MELIKDILRKLIFPKLWIVFLSVLVSAAGLAFVFAGGHEKEWFAYPVFVLSAYALALVVLRIYRAARNGKLDPKAAISSVPIARRYLTDVSFNMSVSLYRSLGLNVLYALLKLAFSIYYRSVWFLSLAVYYFLLAAMRFVLIRYSSRNAYGSKMIPEWKYYRLCGTALMLMNIALTGVVILVVNKNEGFNYAGYLIYIMAMYAFYSMVSAIRNIVKYRRFRSPVMSAAKVLHLVTAMVSMLALETAMLAQFGGNNTEQFRRIMTGSTGGGVCAIILGIAIYMICRSTRNINRLKTEEAR